MSVAELKEKIVARVAEVDDERVLTMSLLALNEPDKFDLELTDEDFRHFDEIEKEVERGEYYTQEEFITLMQEHLDRFDSKQRDEANKMV